MPSLYLDLDGTLLDVSERYWRLHSDLIGRLGLPAISRSRFWELKRARVRSSSLVPIAEEAQRRYWSAWVDLIESSDYLGYDRVIDGVRRSLELLGQSHRLVIATMRKDPEALARQLDKLRLSSYAERILAAGDGDRRAADKHSLIATDCNFASAGDLVVGDTEADIIAGQRLGAATVGVLTGMRDRTRLLQARPNALIPSVAYLPDLLVGAAGSLGGHACGHRSREVARSVLRGRRRRPRAGDA